MPESLYRPPFELYLVASARGGLRWLSLAISLRGKIDGHLFAYWPVDYFFFFGKTLRGLLICFLGPGKANVYLRRPQKITPYYLSLHAPMVSTAIEFNLVVGALCCVSVRKFTRRHHGESEYGILLSSYAGATMI